MPSQMIVHSVEGSVPGMESQQGVGVFTVADVQIISAFIGRS